MDLHCFSPQIVYFCRDFTQKRARGRPRKAKTQRRGVATLRMMCQAMGRLLYLPAGGVEEADGCLDEGTYSSATIWRLM